MRRIALFFFLLAVIHSLQGQVDNVGSGQAIRFDGVDDYLELGNIMDDLSVPFTVSAWIFIDPGTTGALPILVSQDNEPIYNGFWFFVNPTTVWLEMGDGLGENLPAYRRGKSATVPDMRGRWMHVAASVNASHVVSLFANGINVGGAPTGSSMYPMESMSPNDVAKIGYFLSNSVIYRFKGIIDEVRVWNRVLSESEIRETMCKKLRAGETGLIGNWRFDETVGTTIKDHSVNNWSGTAFGAPTRVYSGAPIGDESVYSYSTTNKSIEYEHIKVANVSAPAGAHIYKVNSEPSQKTGIGTDIPDSYYGVFTANTSTGNRFDLVMDTESSCEVSSREDNSQVPWSPLENREGISERAEIIMWAAQLPEVDLGPDVLVCDNANYTIQSNVDNAGLTLLWSTGQASPNVTIAESGTYVLTVSNSCGSAKDSIDVHFASTPPQFDLGDDEVVCELSARTLKAYDTDTDGLQFEWQDGSTADTFTVRDFGTHWVTVRSACGEVADTINFQQLVGMPIPDVDLGSDVVICDRTSHTIHSNVSDTGLTFLWSTGQTSPAITVSSTGTYVLTVTSSCSHVNDTIAVSFAATPPAFDLGDDEITCTFSGRTLKAYDADGGEFEFIWHDGSTLDTFTPQDFGTYWVTVRSVCGEVTDTIRFEKPQAESMIIPNVITPNNDNVNQSFVVASSIGPNQLILYNRWGQEIYQNDDYKGEWEGEGLPSGIYFYRLYNQCAGEKRGTVTILR